MFQWDVRALEILDALEQAGHQAVLVGGCVRDALLGREPHDYDAAVSAPPEEILAAWAGSPTTTTPPSPPRRRRSWPPAVQSSNASPPAWPTGRSRWSTAASRWR